MRFTACSFVAGFGALLLACGPADTSPDSGGDDVRPTCLETVALPCTPLSAATFPAIFANTFHGGCASAGVSCHGSEGRQGGLVFEDEMTAEALLLGKGADGKARVVPGDARCSELIVRLDSPGHSWSMPVGAPLMEAERCSIRQWVQGLTAEPGLTGEPGSARAQALTRAQGSP